MNTAIIFNSFIPPVLFFLEWVEYKLRHVYALLGLSFSIFLPHSFNWVAFDYDCKGGNHEYIWMYHESSSATSLEVLKKSRIYGHFETSRANILFKQCQRCQRCVLVPFQLHIKHIISWR